MSQTTFQHQKGALIPAMFFCKDHTLECPKSPTGPLYIGMKIQSMEMSTQVHNV